jgi:hypothetical protein
MDTLVTEAMVDLQPCTVSCLRNQDKWTNTVQMEVLSLQERAAMVNFAIHLMILPQWLLEEEAEAPS